MFFERAASAGSVQSFEKLISLVANPTIMGEIFVNGHVAPAA